MNPYRFTQLSHGALVHALDEQAASERGCTAVLVALIAEVDERRLYGQYDYPSMFEYCVRRLKLSEDAAYKRIQAARAARRFPGIFEAIADGRLSLTVIVKLRPHLTRENWRELLREAVHKTKTEVEHLLAVRFPKPDVATVIRPVVATAVQQASTPVAQLVPEPVASIAPAIDAAPVSRPVESTAVAPPPAAPARVAPLSAQSYELRCTMSKATHDLMRRAQELLGSRVPESDVDAVLRRGLELLVADLEKRKYAATDKPRVGKPSSNPRYIPARVKRAVRERDQDQCAFVGDDGRRCECRRGLEFDHVLPVARGGEPTVANVRQLCRTHNRLEAERAYGHDFMEGKRLAAATG